MADRIDNNIRKQQAKNKKLLSEGKDPVVFNLIDGIGLNEDDIPKVTCEECGEEFNQDYVEASNSFTNFKTCHKCRRGKRNKAKEVAVYETQLLYSPHPWQEKAHAAIRDHKVVILACGARTGKDYCCIMETIQQIKELANECRPVTDPTKVPSYVIWLIGPTEDILKQNWDQMVKFIPKVFLPKGENSIQRSAMRMELIQGGLLECKSAYDPSMLVSKAVDFCVITEAARIRGLEDVWRNIEARLMSPGCGIGGKGGKVLINSSPLGKNYFYKIYTWGCKSHPMYDSQFCSFQLSTDSNPEVKKQMDEIVQGFNGEKITRREQLRRRWGEKKFLQDYEGQFIDAGGTAFPNIDKCFFNPFLELKHLPREEIKAFIKNWKEPKPAEGYRIGYDPATGSSGDSPILVVRENSTNRIVNQIDLYGFVDDAQLDKVAYWASYYNYAEVVVLDTGNLLVEGQLLKRGVNVKAIGEQGNKKRSYVMSLQAAISNLDITILEDGTKEQETMRFQLEDYSENEKTGKFSNVSEDNDDYVSALYACYHDYRMEIEITSQYSARIGGVPRKKR